MTEKGIKKTTIQIKVARRTNSFQESVIREMTRLGDETNSVNLSQGLPDYDPPSEVIQAAVAAIQSGDNQYTFPFGSPEFRAAIAKKYANYNHIIADPETDITVTCGVSEAMISVILGLTEPGDEIIILEPWYENYVPDCILAGVTPRFVSLHEPDYTFDKKELEAAFNNKTRLIIINTPHNPTGRVLTKEELETIANLCQKFGVIAITDEIYEYILHNDNQHISIGSLDGMQNLSVTISGLGKSYSVTGWRIGWTVAYPELSLPIRKVHDYLTVCAPSAFQTAGITALALPDSYYAGICNEYEKGKNIILNALDEAGLTYFVPQGSYYVMADFSSIKWDKTKYQRADWTLDRNFAEYIAREIGVAIVPGSSFYMNSDQGTTRVRFNFAKTHTTLQKAANRLKNFS